jgi:hypothetical protein
LKEDEDEDEDEDDGAPGEAAVAVEAVVIGTAARSSPLATGASAGRVRN